MKRLLLAALLLLLGATSGARADPPMWVVKRGDSTVYLFATLHVMKRPPDAWKSAKIENALAASQELWTEHNPDTDVDIGATYLLNFGMDDRHPLAGKLGAEDFALFLKLMARYGLGEPQLRFYRPWAAMLLLQSQTLMGGGFTNLRGADMILGHDAKRAGIPVKSLEVDTDWARNLAELSPADELDLLRDTIHEIAAAGPRDAERRTEASEVAWIAGDIPRMSQDKFMLMSAKSPAAYDAVITKRNAAWLPQIVRLLETPGTYFVAVTAMHLTAKGGIPDLLRAKGYKVEPY
jgi:hypothetical protein